MAEWLLRSTTNTTQIQHMDEKSPTAFRCQTDRRVEIACGNIWGHDDSNEVISIYVGTDALNAGITNTSKNATVINKRHSCKP